jgi:NADH dehydrogenase FAD-containing subunit
VGAGHAHLHVAKHARALTQSGAGVLLVDPSDFWYSGLATGVVGGQYACDQDCVTPGPLIERAGGIYIRDRVDAIDVAARRLTLRSGGARAWDLLSINIGSVVATDGIDGVAHATPVKPISSLCRLRRDLEAQAEARGRIDVVVAGGGATGCEVALNVQALARRRHWKHAVTLVAAEKPLLRGFPAGARAYVETTLARRGIDVVYDRVSTIDAESVTLESGVRIESRATVLATGLHAPRLVHELGFPASADGLHVNEYLHVPGQPRVFAVGDCAHFLPRPLPTLGVFGVRQAPVLLHNLAAVLRGEALRAYRPQTRYLTILNLGDGDALARWGEFWWRGRSAMALKEWLDLRFLAKYRV